MVNKACYTLKHIYLLDLVFLICTINGWRKQGPADLALLERTKKMSGEEGEWWLGLFRGLSPLFYSMCALAVWMARSLSLVNNLHFIFVE